MTTERSTVEKWLLVALAIPALVLFVRSRAAGTGALSPTEAASLLKKTKDLQLIDVRTPGEYADGHLAGAKLIPVQELGERLSEIDPKKPVLLYCRTDNRSGLAGRGSAGDQVEARVDRGRSSGRLPNRL
jgi:hypothetical protein